MMLMDSLLVILALANQQHGQLEKKDMSNTLIPRPIADQSALQKGQFWHENQNISRDMYFFLLWRILMHTSVHTFLLRGTSFSKMKGIAGLRKTPNSIFAKAFVFSDRGSTKLNFQNHKEMFFLKEFFLQCVVKKVSFQDMEDLQTFFIIKKRNISFSKIIFCGARIVFFPMHMLQNSEISRLQKFFHIFN